jgi:hypothetical protein
VYWHDWDRLVLLFREAFNFNWPHHPHGIYRALRNPVPDFLEHLEIFVQNMSNAGRGAFLSGRLSDPTAPNVYWKPLGKDGDGFLEVMDRQHLNPATQKDYEEMLAIRRTQPARPDFASDISQDAIWQIIRKIEAIGATPVLIVAPTTTGRSFYPRPRDGDSPLVLDFTDLKRYPELYDEQYRLDTDHLNTPGAIIFTRLLVEQFEEVAKGAK